MGIYNKDTGEVMTDTEISEKLRKLEEYEAKESTKELCCECRAISEEVERKMKIHSEICDYLKNLYAAKNADYGDSMHPLFEEYGLTAFLVLFEIKLNRIKSLQYKGKGYYESLEDSLLDLANYAMIAVTELRDKKNNHKTLDKI